MAVDAQRDEHAGRTAPLLQGHPAAHRWVRPAAPPAADLVSAAQRRDGGPRGRHTGPRGPGRRRDRARRGRPRRGRARGAHRRHRGGRVRHRAGVPVAVGNHRRGPDPRPAHHRVRPRPADARRLLHPHPYRRTGQPVEQRRHRRATGLQQHALRRGQQHRGASAHPRRDDQNFLADHRARAAAATGLRPSRSADGQPTGPARTRGGQPQRGDEHADDRAFLRARRDAGETVRPARARVRRVRPTGTAGP